MPFRRFGFRDGSPLRGVSLTDDAVLVLRQGSALRAGVLSSCFAKKKVAKEEGDPRLRGRLRRLPCATRRAGRLRNSALRASDSPRAFSASSCVARRSTWGPGKASRNDGSAQEKNKKGVFLAVDRWKQAKTILSGSAAAFFLPLRGAEQRRLAGGFRRALFEGRSPELRSRPALRVAQGSRRSRPRSLGSPSSLATFFWRSKRKYARAASAEPNGSASATSRLANAEPNRQTRNTSSVAATKHHSKEQQAC